MAVATREGGVDRNIHAGNRDGQCVVATREGGVDRNNFSWSLPHLQLPSPPARVAWIETRRPRRRGNPGKSPPARVAWIETTMGLPLPMLRGVATREGGVDRNYQ